jgi:hypothetical protein
MSIELASIDSEKRGTLHMEPTNRKLIAVVGATGQQGGAVVRALQATNQFKVRALTRNPAKHRELADEVIQADLARPESLRAALEGAHGVFLVTNAWEEGSDEIQQATAAIRAAKDAGVKHLVWSTLPDVEAISGGKFHVPHFTDKAKVDRLVKEAGFLVRVEEGSRLGHSLNGRELASRGVSSLLVVDLNSQTGRRAEACQQIFPTLTFGVLCCFFIIGHDRRKILHFNVTRNPNALWVVQQLREASGLQTAAQILAIRPRRKVWSGGGFGGEGHGKRANSHDLSQSVAERCCGALGGKLPKRLAGPRDLLTSGGKGIGRDSAGF